MSVCNHFGYYGIFSTERPLGFRAGQKSQISSRGVNNFNLVDVSDAYYYFFCLGRGKGEVRGAGGGGIGFFFILKIPGGRAGFSRRRRSRGAGRVSAANWGIFLGGGGQICFSGPKRPPS